MINNLMWGNTGNADGSDVFFYSADLMLHNNIEKKSGVFGAASLGNISVAPGLVSSGNWHLKHDSPLRNAGYNAGAELLGEHDLDGRTRRMGRAVDIGAYEVEDAFADGFE
jgi:hypothetical protein